jgi:hypothetical protein
VRNPKNFCATSRAAFAGFFSVRSLRLRFVARRAAVHFACCDCVLLPSCAAIAFFFTAALGAFAVGAATPMLLQKSGERLLRVILTAEKFVALDGGDYADGAFVAGLGALNAAEAAHTNRTSQSDFVREG